MNRILQKSLGSVYKIAVANRPSTRLRCDFTMSVPATKTGVPLKMVVDVFHSYANPNLAASWDNVGLLLEPSEEKNINSILLTNDLTEDVTDEAIELNVDLIISYHPPIFSPLKSLTNKHWKERIILKCIERRIALYSPHTCFDSIKGGVNDWLASAFELKESAPIEPSEPASENGMGRFCTLKTPISIEEAINRVKKLTQLPYLRLARARNTTNIDIKTVAVCAGSGSSVLKGIEADLYLTGEMLHHDVLDAVHRGTNVILTNHSDSERGFLKHFAIVLSEKLNDAINIQVSQCDTDPLKTV